MWRYCEKNSDVIWYCESQCERNSAHIVTHIVRRLWEDCEQRWIPLISCISSITILHITRRYFCELITYIKGIHLYSQFSHNLLTIWVTMWEEFRSHCDSQYQMTLEFFSQSIHILLNIFKKRRNSSARKIIPWKKHHKNVNFGPILKKLIFLKWE